MGSASSTDASTLEPRSETSEESIAAASLPIPLLRSFFSSTSSSPLSSSLSLPPLSLAAPSHLPLPPSLPLLLSRLGSSVAALFFPSSSSSSWVAFLQGFNRCTARSSTSESLASLFRLYVHASESPSLTVDDETGKVVGFFSPSELISFLWMCWFMSENSSIPDGSTIHLTLPDVRNLLVSVLVHCKILADDDGIWGFNVASAEEENAEVRVQVAKVQEWVLLVAPRLAGSLARFVVERIRAFNVGTVDSTSKEKLNNSDQGGDSFSEDADNDYLLSQGRAWAISLTIRNALSDVLQGMKPENLLYRSSIHGKGVSRFWSCVEGYNGPILILVSGRLAATHDGTNESQTWVIGALTEQGFENRDTFFGNSGHLYAVDPIFRVLSPSGKEKNFVYFRLHPTRKVYEPKPKPVGLAFGGTIGNERIFIDEDFSSIMIRHHAVDKTYLSGSLIPGQGFIPVQGSAMEVEAWGFGGEQAKEQQKAFRNREKLFTEQRRKVDLKTFGNWEDSPEKMMMDMIADPNRVQREDR